MLEPGLRTAWQEDGWCIIERAVPSELVAGAQNAITHLFPTAEEMESRHDPATDKWREWDAAWPEFPFKSRSLNALVVHDVILDLAEELLGTEDLRLYMGVLTAKYANQSSGFNRLLHADYPNHTVLVPRQEDGYAQLETFIYLSDVTLEAGATRFVSRRYTKDIPVECHTLNLTDYGDLYDDALGAGVAPAGSIVAYRPDVYHRSVDTRAPGTARFMLHVSLRPARAEWATYQSWAFKGFSPEWNRFVCGATPRQLALFGFPRPGDPYWNDETIAGVGARYPDLDMTPWGAASGG